MNVLIVILGGHFNKAMMISVVCIVLKKCCPYTVKWFHKHNQKFDKDVYENLFQVTEQYQQLNKNDNLEEGEGVFISILKMLI